MTQLGCLRVLSQPTYPRAFPLAQVATGLRAATMRPEHHFWADEVPAVDDKSIDMTRVHGSGQLTDSYLLALAVYKGGRFVTLDRRVARSAVRGAEPHHLIVL
jgi:predicted nucleic acid-binding protein